jgi:hypothetical protein
MQKEEEIAHDRPPQKASKVGDEGEALSLLYRF